MDRLDNKSKTNLKNKGKESGTRSKTFIQIKPNESISEKTSRSRPTKIKSTHYTNSMSTIKNPIIKSKTMATTNLTLNEVYTSASIEKIVDNKESQMNGLPVEVISDQSTSMLAPADTLKLLINSSSKNNTSMIAPVMTPKGSFERFEKEYCIDEIEFSKINILKREKCREAETKEIVNRMRKELPVYTLQDIRYFKLPFHEALLLNLEENGFQSTAAYINQLLEFQEEMLKKAHPGSTAQLLLVLKYNKSKLVSLADGLKLAEMHHKIGKEVEECDAFLNIAFYFAFEDYGWSWLGEELLIQSITNSKRYSNGQYEATSRYIYAKFLLEIVQDHNSAIEELKIAEVLSKDKKWESLKYVAIEENLYLQVHHLLYKCFMQEVARLKVVSAYEEAAYVASRAQNSAFIACLRTFEADALLEKGMCEIHLNQPRLAIKTLLRAFSLQKRFGTIEGKCQVRMQLVKASMMLGRHELAMAILLNMISDTEENHLYFYLGQTYQHLGMFFLTKGNHRSAYSVFQEACRIFDENNIKTAEFGKVKNLSAISFGLQIFPEYADIINGKIQRDDSCSENLAKLVRWKDDRIQFWKDDLPNGPFSIHDIINNSTNNMKIRHSSLCANTKYYK